MWHIVQESFDNISQNELNVLQLKLGCFATIQVIRKVYLRRDYAINSL